MSEPPAAVGPRPAPAHGSPLGTLFREPGRFTLDAAIGVLLAAGGSRRPEQVLRFQTAFGLRPAMRDILAVEQEPGSGRYVVRIGFSGLTGPGGVLPRPYTETVNEEHRRRSPALAGFLDMLSQRALLQYALAGAKYHPHRVAALARYDAPDHAPDGDGFVTSLLALAGHGLPGDIARSGLAPGQLLYFAGLFASRPRSADRLAALLEEWLGVPVRIDQFVGTWQRLDQDERSRLGLAHSRLGVDAAAGTRVWDIQSRIRIVIGPLDLPGFEALLPDRDRLPQLDRIIRAYLDDEAAFGINLVLRAASVPSARLGSMRLGWTGWLPTAGRRVADVNDTVFSDVGAIRR